MYVIGVDVGSGSVRAVLLRLKDGNVIDGEHVYRSSRDTTTNSPGKDMYEQNTEEIWQKTCECVKEIVDKMPGDRQEIVGIGFDATCSLVVIDPKGSTKDNVIMWMDHRAKAVAKRITTSGGSVTYQMGNVCSPEFSIAKLVWLKENDPQRFNAARGFMELPDYMTWRALGGEHGILDQADFPRSTCSVVCKWGYDAENMKWSETFLTNFGLEEFVKDPSRIGSKVVMPGIKLGSLSERMMKEMGIISATHSGPLPSVAVSSSLIDAHAGVLAMLALFGGSHPEPLHELAGRVFCMIAGTSTCNMVSVKDRRCVQGIWGPYLHAIYPGYNTWEPGQSATGKLLEHVVMSHAETKEKHANKSLYEIVTALNAQLPKDSIKTDVHVISSFHGNRAPFAKPELRGGYYGLTLAETPLREVYAATMEALAYDTKLIIDRLALSDLHTVLLTGGLGKNEVCCQVHADVFGMELDTVTLGEADMTLVGAALLGRQAALELDTSFEKLENVTAPTLKVKKYKPNPQMKEYHTKKYAAHVALLETADRVERIMKHGADAGRAHS